MQSIHQPITYSSYVTFNLLQYPSLYLYSDGFMDRGIQLRSFHNLYGSLFHDFQNSVFRILPVMNYQKQHSLIDDNLLKELEKDSYNLKQRKQLVQTMINGLTNEMNSNVSVYNKLKGTPLLFTSSTFHLVHVSSLKFLALDDENLEDLRFDLIDFPNDKCILRFNPCLSFQKMMTNVVYTGDILVLASTKSVVNRYPNLFCTYHGYYYDQMNNTKDKELKGLFLKEVQNAKIWATVDDQTKWRVNVYRPSDEEDQKEQLYVGDVIALQLSERNLCIDTQRQFDPFEKVLHLLNNESQSKVNKSSINTAINELATKQYNQLQTLFPNMIPVSNDLKQSLINHSHVSATPRQNSNEMELSKEILNHDLRTHDILQMLDEHLDRPAITNSLNADAITEINLQDDVALLKKLILDDFQVVFAQPSLKRNLVARSNQLPPSCLWKIEAENHHLGGFVYFEKQYRLRHFQTGQYLEIVKDNQISVKVSTQVTKNTLFQLIPLRVGGKSDVKKDSFFYLKHTQSGLIVSVSLNEKNEVTLQDEPSEQNIFKMRKADEDDIWEIRFLLFTQPLIMEVVQFIGWMKPRKNIQPQLFKVDDIKDRLHFHDLCKRVDRMLTLLEQFVNNSMICNISQLKDYGQQAPLRQDIVREQNVMALLCWALFRSFPEKEDFEKLKYPSMQSIIDELMDEREFIYQCSAHTSTATNTLHPKKCIRLQDHHIKRQIWLSYRFYQTLQQIAKDKPQNQHLIAKFLNMFQAHLGQAEFVVDFLWGVFGKNKPMLVTLSKGYAKAISTITNSQLLAHSQMLLEQTGDRIFLRELINKFKQFERYSKSDFLRFLANVCRFGNEAIFSNQEIIFKTLIEDTRMRRLALFQLDQNLTIMNDLEKEFCETCPLEIFLKGMHSEYIKSQLELYANLSLGRNFNASQMLRSTFTNESLCKYIFMDGIEDDVRATLLQLLRTLYIDREPHAVQVKPNLVRVVNLDPKGGDNPAYAYTPYNFVIYGQAFEKLFLYEDDDNLIGISIQDQSEMNKFIQSFKLELLDYLKSRCDILSAKVNTSMYKQVYNKLTLEVINSLYIILQFGLFSRGTPQTQKSRLFSQEKKPKESEIERLITYLALMLEFDSSYYRSLSEHQLKRKYEEQRLQKQNLNAFIMENGISSFGDNFQAMFTGNGKKQSRSSKNMVKVDTADFVDDPLFRKVRGLVKMLDRYNNKTFTLRQDIEGDVEVKIKMMICQVFSYLLDMRQDFLIDNVVTYFQSSFFANTSAKKPNDDELITLLPEDILKSGQNFEDIPPMKYQGQLAPLVKNFDSILERPFLEVLLMALYFSQNSELENRIVELLERYVTQKNELIRHLKKLQLLMDPEQQQIYYIQFSMTTKLKNYVQYSQIWLQLETPALQNGRNEDQIEKTQSILWKLENILQKSSDVSASALRSRQSMFYNIGGYFVVLELVDKALSVIDAHLETFEMRMTEDPEEQYRQELAEKIISMVQLCVKILGLFARNNPEFQESIFKNIVRLLMNYTTLNLGQVDLISDLFRENYQLIGLLQISDVNYFVELIVQHGKFAEFLNFFDIILETSEKQSNNPELHKLVLTTLFNGVHFDHINPFKEVDNHQSNFYTILLPDLYKQRFLRVVSRCLRLDIGVSLITQCYKLIQTRELLQYLLEKAQEMRDPHLNEELQRQYLKIKTDVCGILYRVSLSSKDCLNDIAQNSNIFVAFMSIETSWLERQQRFIDEYKSYLLDELLPLTNIYNEMFIVDTASTIFRTNHVHQNLKKQMREFGLTLIHNLERMFFKTPAQIQQVPERIKQITHLSSIFSLTVPKHIFQARKRIHQNQDLEAEESFSDSDSEHNFDTTVRIQTLKTEQGEVRLTTVAGEESSSTIEEWNLLLIKLQQNDKIQEVLKLEASTLSQSIWKISDMFQQNVKGPQKDLLLQSEDLVIKILKYLQFWQDHASMRENVIFILKVLKSILKDSDDEIELQERQMFFDRLNATKILTVLFQDENENDPEYLLTLLKFAIILIQGGNRQVQRTLYSVFVSSSSCERFFYKIKKIINSQIATSTSHIKLGPKETKLVAKSLKLLQLMCEGHNQEMQNYLRYQNNQKISHDLVSLTVQLLASIQITEMNYEIVMQCFCTLTQFIEGPCRANQIVVGNSKFLEYAVMVLSEDEKVFPQIIHRGKVARLKFRCLITITALLECNDPQDTLILRIIRSVPLTVLTNNLTQIFSLFKQHFKEEYDINLFNRSLLKIDSGVAPSFYEMIIENGFYIFSLMQLFLSNKKGKDMLYEDSDMRDVLNEFQAKESDLQKLLKDNFFAELSKLGGSLAKHGLNALGNLKKNFEDILKDDAQLQREEELKKKREQKELTKNSIKFFKENTCSVEMIRDKHIHTVYFPKLPFCKLLPKDLKEEFHDAVPRTSSKTKLTYLMDQTDELVQIMKHEEKLRIIFRYNPLLGIFANHGKLWEQCAFISTIILNILICFSYSQYFVSDKAEPSKILYNRIYSPNLLFDKSAKNTQAIITTCGTVNLAFNSLVVFFFLIKRAPLKIQFLWEPLYDWMEKQPKLTISIVFKFIVFFCIKSIHSLWVLLQDFDILYYSMYIMANIVGLIVHPFYFAFHLLDFLRVEQLKTVVQAMWVPRVELFLALSLIIILEYYFTITGYIVFYDEFEILDERGFRIMDAPQICDAIWTCFIHVFDQTFKNTGGIGTGMQDPRTIQTQTKGMTEEELSNYSYEGIDMNDPISYMQRFAYDNFENLLILYVLLNMMQGIIINMFSLLKTKQSEKVDDQTFFCFICGISREKLDKSSGENKGFFYHIKQEHYMWNYVFYRAFLNFKGRDLNGNESYVFDKIEKADISWFPIKRAKAITEMEVDERLSEDELSYVQHQVKRLSSTVEKIFYRVTDLMEEG